MMTARRLRPMLLVLVLGLLLPAAAQATVSNVKVSNDVFNEDASTFTAGSNQSAVVYFTINQALGGNSTITIDGPVGTVMPAGFGYQVGVGSAGWSVLSSSRFDNNTAVTLTMHNSFSAPAGTRIDLLVGCCGNAMTQPTAAGAKTLTVRTSAEPVNATSAGYTILPGAASQMQATSGDGQSTTVADGFDPLKVKVMDQFGNAVSGKSVTVDLPSGGATGTFDSGTAGTYTANTDSNGEITTPTITASTVSGLWHPFVSSSGLTGFNMDLTNNPDDAFSMATHTGNNQSAKVGTAYADFVVKVTDQYGNVVPGEDVTFSVPGSGPSGQFLSTTFPVQTGNDGLASSGTLTANGTPGSFLVTASHSLLGNLTFNAENLVGDPAVIQASGLTQTATVGQDFAQQINMQVFDAYGNPVPGVNLALNLPSTGPSAHFPGNATTFLGATNSTGNLLAPVMTANTIAGDWTGTASASGVPDTIIDETNAPDAPAAMTTVSGGGQSVGTGGAFTAPVVVKVADQFGNPIAGAPVTFAAPTSGPSGSPATAGPTTNAAGQASSGAITANSKAGQWTLTASAGPLSTTASLTNLDVTAPTVTITKKPKARSTNRRARFAFKANEAVKRFECKVDSGKLQSCTSPTTRRVKPGRHTFKVRAIDTAGNVGAFKTVHFRIVKPRRR